MTRRIMNKLSFTTAIALLFLSLPLTGCTGFTSGIKDGITIKDSLALRGGCVIAGKVVDNNTDEPIKDAHIVMLSKPTNTVTDLYGQFEIIDITPGIYTLQVFCVGYLQKNIPDIEAKPDRLIKLEVRLESRPDH
jgi:hypothetical protein